MNRYIGKICPYCKTAIEEGDAIVVCSVCEMPHHKDCWIDNQGCTTFGCTGTISTPEKPSEETPDDFEITLYDNDFPVPEPHKYCPRCGEENREGSNFCCKCGAVLQPRSDLPAQQQSNQQYWSYKRSTTDTSYQNPDSVLLIGVNADYYTAKFSEMRRQGKKGSWNWSAFLVTPYWMIYRKMYGYGAGVLCGLLLLSLLGGWVAYLLQAAVYITFGILSNSIYMDSIEKKTSQSSILSEPYRSEYIRKNGGTNIAAAILCAVGYAVFIAAI